MFRPKCVHFADRSKRKPRDKKKKKKKKKKSGPFLNFLFITRLGEFFEMQLQFLFLSVH